MDELKKNSSVDVGGDKDILFSKTIKAGKRIYYLDVKRSSKDDLFVAITESKRVQAKGNTPVSFEKHKIFIYREDFDRFATVLKQVMDYANDYKTNANKQVHPADEPKQDNGANTITLEDLQFE